METNAHRTAAFQKLPHAFLLWGTRKDNSLTYICVIDDAVFVRQFRKRNESVLDFHVTKHATATDPR